MGPLKKLALLVVVCGLVCFHVVFNLLYVALIFIKNPLRTLRKIQRDSELRPSPNAEWCTVLI